MEFTQDISVGFKIFTSFYELSIAINSKSTRMVYQTRHFISGFIRLPFSHWNASEKASQFCRDPRTLNKGDISGVKHAESILNLNDDMS